MEKLKIYMNGGQAGIQRAMALMKQDTGNEHEGG